MSQSNTVIPVTTLPGESPDRQATTGAFNDIENKHPEYDANLRISTRNQDFVRGETQVKAKGKLYLPAVNPQQDNNIVAYQRYLRRTNFYNSAGRSVAALHGSLFRVDPLWKNTESIDSFIENIDLTGRSLLEFVRDVTEQYMITGNEFIYTEFSGSSVGMSRLQAETSNKRPYLVHGRNADILDWSYRVINGQRKLSMIKLYSKSQSNVRDVINTEEKITLLYLDSQGIYNQAIYTKSDEDWMLTTADFKPLVNGATISFIPGTFIGKPFSQAIIGDLVAVNEKHYASSADLAHALLLVALPNVTMLGVSETEANNFAAQGIGGQLYASMNPDAELAFMAYDGKGVELLITQLGTMERQIASLGAKSLVSDTAMSESADALMIKSSGDHANLGKISAEISKAMARVLNIMALFVGYTSNDITFSASQSFVNNKISHQELTALVAAWQNGAMSFETLHENLQRGEIADQEVTYEEEQEKIKDSAPMVGAMEMMPDEIIEVDRVSTPPTT